MFSKSYIIFELVYSSYDIYFLLFTHPIDFLFTHPMLFILNDFLLFTHPCLLILLLNLFLFSFVYSSCYLFSFVYSSCYLYISEGEVTISVGLALVSLVLRSLYARCAHFLPRTNKGLVSTVLRMCQFRPHKNNEYTQTTLLGTELQCVPFYV